MLSSERKSFSVVVGVGLSLRRDCVERTAGSKGTEGSYCSGEERIAREGGERERPEGSAKGEPRLEPKPPPPEPS